MTYGPNTLWKLNKIADPKQCTECESPEQLNKWIDKGNTAARNAFHGRGPQSGHMSVSSGRLGVHLLQHLPQPEHFTIRISGSEREAP